MFSKTLLAWGLLLLGRSDAAPTRVQRMTVTKMRASDLESSATGYVYNQQQGLPVYYVQYTNHGSGGYYRAPDTLHYVAPVAHTVPETAPLLLGYAAAENALGHGDHQETANYANAKTTEHATTPIASEPLAPYFVAQKMSGKGDAEGGSYHVAEKSNGSEEDEGDSYEDDDDDEEDEEDHEDHEDGDEGKSHGGFGHPVKEFNFAGSYGDKGSGGSHGLAGSSFEAGGGGKHSAEEHSERGESGRKGYKNRQEFSKGEHGSDDNEHDQGHYSEEGGRKKGHVDEAEEHGSHEESEKGAKGSDYGRSSGHKNGRKTNGFHNIYHKDEYKKETDFYDDEHKKGYFDKYDEFDKGYKAVEGGFKKGGHHSSGHDQEDRGKKGRYDKGHHDSQDQGHDSEEGEKSYYAKHEDYGDENQSKFAKSHEFRKGDAGHH